jgi:predicted PurR-regulated permease PerM
MSSPPHREELWRASCRPRGRMNTFRPAAPAWDLTRILLAVAAIGGLIAASFWVLRPFLPAVIWATMIVVATWPALCAVQARLRGRRSLAVAVMTLAMLTILAAPLAVATVTIVEHADLVVAWVKSVGGQPIPAPPQWVGALPLAGPRLATEWQNLSSARPEDLASRVAPYLAGVVAWLIAQVGNLGSLFVQLLLTVGVCAVMYARGEVAAEGVLAFARRLAGEPGERVVRLSAGAIRGVALGIVVTALIQAVIGGIGLAVTGVPHALLLASIMFLLAIAQIGPAPVLLGGAVWLYLSGHSIWAVVLLGWTVATGSLDNVLRPALIRKGADLPFILIFAGVLGGMLAFGLLGLFVGPVVLAVTYTLLVAWVTEGNAPPA